MRLTLALFTRDLRVHDNPVLAAATAQGDVVVPLFALDPKALAAASPNRRWALAQALADLRAGLRRRGGDLVVRRGPAARVVADVLEELWQEGIVGVGDEVTVHVARDASAFADGRSRALHAVPVSLACQVRVVEHDSHLVVPPGGLTTTTGGSYRVFTPYFRAWDRAERRPLAPTPTLVVLPAGLPPGELPSPRDLAAGAVSPQLVSIAESSALRRANDWLAGEADQYDEARDRLDLDGTSRLSGPLHFGTISVRWLEEQLDPANPGHAAFRRQLCWRDFHHQVLADFPDLPRRNLRDRGDLWLHDRQAVEAWRTGRTGHPIVDAAMRQLRAEGWMHNRARMIVATFLTKHLYVDWRIGAAHFDDWLVDADVANNAANWQWVAGTGSDTRPNRMMNPLVQAERFDPEAAYIRRWVPELSHLADPRDVREPWRLAGTLHEPDYPRPVIDLRDARQRFLQARGA